MKPRTSVKNGVRRDVKIGIGVKNGVRRDACKHVENACKHVENACKHAKNNIKRDDYRQSSVYMTFFEKISLIMTRAEELSTKELPLIDINDLPIEYKDTSDFEKQIAIKELEMGYLNHYWLERKLPDGSKERFYISEMIIPE